MNAHFGKAEAIATKNRWQHEPLTYYGHRPVATAARSLLLPPTMVTTPRVARSLAYAVIMAEEKLAVGKRFSNFSEVESALNNLRKDGHHLLRVYNSQKGEDYNRKRLSRKYPGEPFDVS